MGMTGALALSSSKLFLLRGLDSSATTSEHLLLPFSRASCCIRGTVESSFDCPESLLDGLTGSPSTSDSISVFQSTESSSVDASSIVFLVTCSPDPLRIGGLGEVSLGGGGGGGEGDGDLEDDSESPSLPSWRSKIGQGMLLERMLLALMRFAPVNDFRFPGLCLFPGLRVVE